MQKKIPSSGNSLNSALATVKSKLWTLGNLVFKSRFDKLLQIQEMQLHTLIITQ